MKPKDKLVKVYTAHGEMEAQVIKGLLESCGIPSLMQGNAAHSMQPFVMDGMGEVKIMVTEAQADEARKIIEAKQMFNWFTGDSNERELKKLVPVVKQLTSSNPSFRNSATRNSKARQLNSRNGLPSHRQDQAGNR